MNHSTSIPKPESFSDRDWRDLLLAARTGWLTYVLPWRWSLLCLSGIALGAFIASFFISGRNPSAALHHFLSSEFFTWGICFFVGFRVLIRSIDRVGKRKLARQIGLLPSTPRA